MTFSADDLDESNARQIEKWWLRNECCTCSIGACVLHPGTEWRDMHGDMWRLGSDGLMHSYETASFPRGLVERKWGPLCPVPVDSGDSNA